MSFFSWFKSKSEKSEQDELQPQKPAGVEETQAESKVRPGAPIRVAPRLRETIPQPHARDSTPSSLRETFRRPLRAPVELDLGEKPPSAGQPSETQTEPATVSDTQTVGTIEQPPPPEQETKEAVKRLEPAAPLDLTEQSATEVPVSSAPVETSEPPEAAQGGDDSAKTLRLPLKPILENLPPECQPLDMAALLGKSDLMFDLPLELIQSQMASGKVGVPYPTFLKSLPQEARIHFAETGGPQEVMVPIKEILPNYPADLLHPRPDQEPEEAVPPIATPFATATKEDTERFSENKPAADQEEPGDTRQLELIGRAEPPVQPETDLQGEEPTEEARLLEPNLKALQSIFLAENSLDLDQIIQKVGEFPGISAALLFGVGGKILEGNPEKLGLTPPAVQLLSNLANGVGKQAEGLGFGPVETMTLGWARELISVFTRGQAGIIVRHARRPFKPGVREKIGLVLSHISS